MLTKEKDHERSRKPSAREGVHILCKDFLKTERLSVFGDSFSNMAHIHMLHTDVGIQHSEHKL